MVVVFTLMLVVLVVLTVFLAASIGVAFLLHWLIPAVGMDMALLIAVLAIGQTTYGVGRVFAAGPPLRDDDAELGGEPPPIVILDREVALPRRRRRRPN